jgi:hypothetical protein
MKSSSAKDVKVFDIQQYIKERLREKEVKSIPHIMPESVLYCEVYSAKVSVTTCVKRWGLSQSLGGGWSSNAHKTQGTYERCFSCAIGEKYAKKERSE